MTGLCLEWTSAAPHAHHPTVLGLVQVTRLEAHRYGVSTGVMILLGLDPGHAGVCHCGQGFGGLRPGAGPGVRRSPEDNIMSTTDQ